MSSTKKEASSEEILLKENPHRFSMFPIQYPIMFRLYKLSVSLIWPADEIDLSKDAKNLHLLNPNELYFLKQIFGFFSVADGIVSENIAARMLKLVQIPEARAFYSYQIYNEQVHAETYGMAIETYVPDPVERKRLFEAMTTMPTIQAKADWFLRRLNDDNLSFAHRLLATAINEGLFFQASFASIFWFKHVKFVESPFGSRVHPELPGLFQLNALIARDEGLHFFFACYLYRQFIQEKLPESEVHDLIRSAVVLEENFAKEALPCKLVGMNDVLLIQYVHFVANQICGYLDVAPLYKDRPQNPFPFMEELALCRRSNFFELLVTEYKHPRVVIPPQTNVHFIAEPVVASSTATTSTPAVAAVSDFRLDLEE